MINLVSCDEYKNEPVCSKNAPNVASNLQEVACLLQKMDKQTVIIKNFVCGSNCPEKNAMSNDMPTFENMLDNTAFNLEMCKFILERIGEIAEVLGV